MSTAIDYLRQNGLSARVKGDRLIVSPAGKLTPTIRQYIKAHRLELIAEVAANDGLARSSHWRIIRDGKAMCTMIGPPITYQEALAAAQWRWSDATVEENRLDIHYPHPRDNRPETRNDTSQQADRHEASRPAALRTHSVPSPMSAWRCAGTPRDSTNTCHSRSLLLKHF